MLGNEEFLEEIKHRSEISERQRQLSCSGPDGKFNGHGDGEVHQKELKHKRMMRGFLRAIGRRRG